MLENTKNLPIRLYYNDIEHGVNHEIETQLDENLWNVLILIILIPTGGFIGYNLGSMYANFCLRRK